MSSEGRLDVCLALPGCIDSAPPAPPPAGPPPSSPPVTPPPVLSALKIAPSTFKAARSRLAASGSLHVGATVSYRDTEPALTQFTVFAARSGVLNKAKHCVAPPRGHSRGRGGKRCTRYVRAASFTRADSLGGNRFRFSGRIGRAKLAPGRYRLRAVPVFGGVAGSGARAAFRIVS